MAFKQEEFILEVKVYVVLPPDWPERVCLPKDFRRMPFLCLLLEFLERDVQLLHEVSPHDLVTPKALPPSTVTLKLRISTHDFLCGMWGRSIQMIVLTKSHILQIK